MSASPVAQTCAWCPSFDPNDPKNADASHGICPACAERARAEIAAVEEAEADNVVALLHGGEEE